jgi:hypothetical protein
VDRLVPVLHLPWVLIDNYKQAMKCMGAQEKRLIRSRRLEDFNSQFYDTVERRVFWKLSLQEIANYSARQKS